jgi:hypothetical protein
MSGEMLAVVALAVVPAVVWIRHLYTQQWYEKLVRQHQDLLQLIPPIEQKKDELIRVVQLHFMIQPCFRCHEFTMTVLEISPNGRSVHVVCQHCGKKTHAPAGSPEASGVVELRQEWHRLMADFNERRITFSLEVARYAKRADKVEFDAIPQLSCHLQVEAPAAPLPYEQTTRSPIPEAIRSEVWRRDCGRCVQCRSNQNLQFDHIIPVSRGGATTVANLQLLCESCNKSKGKTI